jgi:hypothetical protein
MLARGQTKHAASDSYKCSAMDKSVADAVVVVVVLLLPATTTTHLFK